MDGDAVTLQKTSNFFMASYLSHSESFKCVCEGREEKYNCGSLTESSLPIKLFDREEMRFLLILTLDIVIAS